MYDRLLIRERLLCILTGITMFISSVVTFTGGRADEDCRE